MATLEEIVGGLSPIDRALIEKRHLGKSYAKVVEELQEEFGADAYTEGTCRVYLSIGGKLYEQYHAYVAVQNEQKDKEAKEYFAGLIMNAVAVISEEMGDKASENPRRLSAALAVIEKHWGKSLQPIEISGDLGVINKYADLTTDELRDYVAELERGAKETAGADVSEGTAGETGASS